MTVFIDPQTNLQLEPAALIANGTTYTETTTSLAASANYTGVTRDMGATYQGYNRVRILCAANAGMGHGHIAIEQSVDGTTWRETDRYPMPSDGSHYLYDLPVVLRFVRLRFYNGAVAQTSFFLSATYIREDGALDVIQSPIFMNTNMPLAASATFTGVTLNVSSPNPYSVHRAWAYADQAGTLYLEQSMTGSMWRTTASVAVSANTTVTLEDKISAQYLRVRFVNGATAQGNFEIMSTLIHA